MSLAVVASLWAAPAFAAPTSASGKQHAVTYPTKTGDKVYSYYETCQWRDREPTAPRGSWYLPQQITAGPDGDLYFTNSGDAGIGRITIRGKITVCTPTEIPVAGAVGITTAADRALWFTYYDGIGRLTPSGDITMFQAASIHGAGGITVGPDGALWFTNSNSIGRITTKGNLSSYSGPGISGAEAITVGPDGALWFTNSANNSIGRITTHGQVTNYTGVGINYPYAITAGPDGALWFTNGVASPSSQWASIGRITTKGVVSTFSTSFMEFLGGITVGPDGALWFTDNGPIVGRVTTKGKISLLIVPRPTNGIYGGAEGITAGRDGALWFADPQDNAIGRVPMKGKITVYVIPPGNVPT